MKNCHTWFCYSERVGGDTIAFFQRFHNKTFPETMEYLLAWSGHPRGPPALVTEKSF